MQSSVTKNYPDLIFVSEIWIYSHEILDFAIPGYNFYANTNDLYSAGGVGVFVRSVYECEYVDYNLTSADVLKVSLSISCKVFTFICVYRLHAIAVQTF